jgi:hypothetical protein
VSTTLYRALRASSPGTRAWLVTFPIWLYVSVTGVVVYWMLYHGYPREGGTVDRTRVQAIRRAMGSGARAAARRRSCGPGPDGAPLPGLRAHLRARDGVLHRAIYRYGPTVGLAVGGTSPRAWLAPTPGWQVAGWGAFAVLFPLWSFRYSKALWLALDHLVDPTDAAGEPGQDGPS